MGLGASQVPDMMKGGNNTARNNSLPALQVIIHWHGAGRRAKPFRRSWRHRGCKNYGRAEVIEPLVTDTSSRFYGRVRVRYQQDGKTYYVRPEALRKAIQVRFTARGGGDGNRGYGAITYCGVHQGCKHVRTCQGVAWCGVGCMVNVRAGLVNNTSKAV